MSMLAAVKHNVESDFVFVSPRFDYSTPLLSLFCPVYTDLPAESRFELQTTPLGATIAEG